MTIRAVENWSLPAGGTQRNGARTEDCTRWSAARQDEGFCNPRLLNWRNIAITLIIRSMSAIATIGGNSRPPEQVARIQGTSLSGGAGMTSLSKNARVAGHIYLT